MLTEDATVQQQVHRTDYWTSTMREVKHSVHRGEKVLCHWPPTPFVMSQGKGIRSQEFSRSFDGGRWLTEGHILILIMEPDASHAVLD